MTTTQPTDWITCDTCGQRMQRFELSDHVDFDGERCATPVEMVLKDVALSADDEATLDEFGVDGFAR